MRQPSKAERSRSWQVPVETGFGFFFVAEHFSADGLDGDHVLCVSAALLRELGHLIVMALFRVKLVRVRLQTLEIGIERQEARSLMSELCIDLAGPAVNLLLAAVCYRWGAWGSPQSTARWVCLNCADRCGRRAGAVCAVPAAVYAGAGGENLLGG